MLPARCATRKPQSNNPVIARTTFLPTDVDKAFNSQRKVVSFFVSVA